MWTLAAIMAIFSSSHGPAVGWHLAAKILRKARIKCPQVQLKLPFYYRPVVVGAEWFLARVGFSFKLFQNVFWVATSQESSRFFLHTFVNFSHLEEATINLFWSHGRSRTPEKKNLYLLGLTCKKQIHNSTTCSP